MEERREVIGLAFRGLRAELQRRGLYERVLGHLQGAARETLESPPFHTTWTPASRHDEIIFAVVRETSYQTVRDIYYSVAKNTTGPVLRPLLKTILSLSGATPLSLINNLNRIMGLQVRGVHFAYEAETPTSGVVTVSHEEPVAPEQYAIWEGVFTFAGDILAMRGQIDAAVPLPDGRSARIRVAW